MFSDKKALNKINDIIHPAVIHKYNLWLRNHSNAPYTLHEAAVLFENNLQSYFDKIICITAPADIRISRVVNRDNILENDVKKRMENQWSDKKKAQLSDFVIVNDGKRFLIPQILEIHKKLINTKK